MARVGERGSIISFIVVGVVLVGLVAGGIYLAKHTLSPLAQQAGTEVAVTNPDDSPSTNGGDQEPQDKDKTQAEKDEAAKQAAEAEKKAQAEREAQEAKEREQEEQQASSDSDDEEEAASEESVSESDYTLPQTGPAEIVGTGFILAVVTGSVIAYRRSTQVL